MRRPLLRSFFILSVFFAAPSLHAANAPDMLAPARAALTSARQQLQAEENSQASTNVPQDGTADPEQQSIRRVELLLKTGQEDKALDIAHTLRTGSPDARLMAFRVFMAVRDYQRAGELITELSAQHDDNPRVRDQLYRWWELRGDLARVEAALRDRETRASLAFIDRAHSADLELRSLDYKTAHAAYSELATLDLSPEEHARVLRGIGISLFHLQRYPEALTSLQDSLALAPLDASTLTSMADTLLRLGRPEDAVDVLTFVLQMSPQNERAHILLGSGFTRRNYTQLASAYPNSFADAQGRSILRNADRDLQKRRIDNARRVYQELASQHPAWADVQARLGSLEYSERNYGAAREHYLKALALCPEYGRAHEGLARTLQALDLAINIHLQADEAALQSATMPAIPNIQRYVINWGSLSARHQKRLALSLLPWARYVPVLVEGGATLYVKPPYQMLSETPYNEKLHDQRIDYDTRLWDDVRGVGGHHTVVGLEDIETRISNGYDTALHEVSHQVHALLAPEWRRKIQVLYAETMRKQKTSGDAFLSQYAASSEWEYFAEGANSLHTPRRDRFDMKEIVLERLQAYDPALLTLTEEIMDKADVGPSYAIALLQRGHDQLTRGKPHDADAFYRRALRRAPREESALLARVYALAVLGRTREAAQLAETAHRLYPQSGATLAQFAEMKRLCGEEITDIVRLLAERRAQVRPEEQYTIDAQIGALHLHSGNTAEARRAFTAALKYQPANAHALAGLATAEALENDWSLAWTHYDDATRMRAGDIDLRVLFARALLRAGELERAHQQIATALLLDPDNPDALAVEAWRLMLVKDFAAARETAARAHKLGSWSTMATIMAAALEQHAGYPQSAESLLAPVRARMGKHAPPEFVYLSKQGRYELLYTLPIMDVQFLNEMMRSHAFRFGRALASPGEALVPHPRAMVPHPRAAFWR